MSTTRGGHRAPRLAYPGTLLLLAVAAAFPIALMVLDPDLMFKRGWEQYVGTSLYLGAVAMLGLELGRLWSSERAFAGAAGLLDEPDDIAPADRRILPARLRGLLAHVAGDRPAPVAVVMELNREASALDQEAAAGRFTLTRYILYLLPVIGFIGTVEGISKALLEMGKVLPLVKDLDGFLANLTSVTGALQLAFDSTLLALFLSAALMFVQTLVVRRSDDLLARVDAWVVEHVLPRTGSAGGPDAASNEGFDRAILALEALGGRLDSGLGGQVDRLAAALDRLAPALVALQRGAESLGDLGADLAPLAAAGDALRKGAATLGRIEAALLATVGPDESIEAIRRGVDRSGAAIEALAGQWAAAFERTSRSTQDQLARTLASLKDALDLLQVSIEQGNALYRNIVKKMLPIYNGPPEELAA